MRKLYLAYGSNLSLEQMARRTRHAFPVGTATLDGYQLLFRGSMSGSYLTVEPCEGRSVPLVVWSVDEVDEQALDRYEGFPNFYYKKEMLLPIKGIRSGKIRMRNIFVYIMHEDRPFGLPSRFYTSTCMEGYKSFGFDSRYLVEAIKNSRRMCHERNEYHPD